MVTLIVPVVPLVTTAVTVVAFTTETELAAVPPILIAVAPVKFVPVIVTVAPIAPVVGVKDVMVGAATQGVTTLAIKLPKEVGPIPTATVAVTVLLAVLITLTSLLQKFVT